MRRAPIITIVAGLGLALTPVPAAAAPVGSPVVFRPQRGTTLHVDGRGSFHGTIEIRREGRGLTIVNELDLDDYVAGVREVPGMWPIEALKAQAVAARTYVLWEKERGHWQQFGFDVCGTTACQVYQGAEAERGERGRRWRQAVDTTADEVLLHDGQPALARYHASSGGRTLANEVVYPSSGARPYLRAVDDPADTASPLHRWDVAFTREELELVLRHGIGLAGTLSEVIADEDARKVTVRTLGGSIEMSSVRLRRVVSDKAPVLFPRKFPGLRGDGERMPFTLPSSRFIIEKTADGFVVHGRGYGHGVGMSQWGAKGRADRGDGYADILNAYYSGLDPQRWPGPRTIRVAVVRGTSAVRVSGDGAFGVFAGGDTLAASTLGGWSVAASGERSLGLTPPQGFDLPLVLSDLRAPDELLVDPPEQGTSLDADFVVPKPAEVTGILTRAGEEVARARVVVEAGERRLSLPLDPERLGGRDTYRLELTAFDGADRVAKASSVVLHKPRSNMPLWAGAFAALALGLSLVYRSSRRRRGQSSTMPVRGQASASPHG